MVSVRVYVSIHSQRTTGEGALGGGGKELSEAVATLDVGVWRRRHLCVVPRWVRSYFGRRFPAVDAHRIR